MKLYTKTFGCQMNFADSDEMGRHFRERGFLPTDSELEANAILINTCTVRDLAEHKAASYIGRLKDWKQANPQGMIVVTGCAAERAKGEFKRKFQHIDLIVGAKDIESFPKELDRFLESAGIDEENLPPRAMVDSSTLPSSFDLNATDHPRPSPVIQYVTIMRGCNYNCTYCIVPSVRGREVYRPIDEILSDVKNRVAEGAKEVWLLGQTVNSYKPTVAPTNDYDFADLLRDVNKTPGLERIRFMSPHPFYLTDKLIDALSQLSQVCEYMHLPVQSGSNKMLKAMKRNYTREGYLAGVEKLRKKIPNIAITTDIIVGFPGETQEDFELTKSLVEAAQFDSAYCFKYSPRPGTVSYELSDDVDQDIKEARVNELLSLTDLQGIEKVKKLVGTVQEVLVEEDKGNGLFRGKTRGAWKVRFQGDGLKLGDIVKLKMASHHSRELHGEKIAS